MILTARLDGESQAWFQALRDEHFPPERNIVPAHLTLFHHLPGSEAASIGRDLTRYAGQMPPMPVEVVRPYSLGKGVAFRLRADALAGLRADLADAWQLWLIPQDQNKWTPHITVQNKVQPTAARALLTRLEAGFVPRTATATGLTLWRYDNGPWTHVRDVAFRGR